MNIPSKQVAIQLVGPDQLTLNADKPVYSVGPYQILGHVNAVGLCFSDLKLLKQFSEHVRKSDILTGIDPVVLDELPSYCPNGKPTVPGHEAVLTIVAVGDEVKHHTVGQRVLAQTDYRWLKTAGSNAAFGYNLEGALQEYVLMDERVIVDPATQESFLIPVPDHLSASATGLVEPWACVESSYVTEERQTVLTDGRLLVVAETGRQILGLAESCSPSGKPASVTACCADPSQVEVVKDLGVTVTVVNSILDLAGQEFDDIIYFGAQKTALDQLNDNLGKGGIINVVLAGQTIGSAVTVGVGRVHYGLTRWIGTIGKDAAESYKVIPAIGEIRDQDHVAVIGAAGPMGQMHTIRLVCSGKEAIAVTGTDLDQARLNSLAAKAQPFADKFGVDFQLINTKETPLEGRFDYIAIMVPVAALVAQAIAQSKDKTLINVFAGIPAPVKHDLDLDTYIQNRCFMFGTSGSRLIDMKLVLDKVISGQLDTNCSVDAVSGMVGAIDGIRAVENRTLSGKIIVYPDLHDMGLTPLDKLPDSVKAVLDHGMWTKAAEEELLKVAK
jgi:threonine dehydrogenase-like Zn-dependent dehydrogenase